MVEALDASDMPELSKELGDLFLHVVLQATIAEQAGEFTFRDVLRQETEKLIRRHPHVFGKARARGYKESITTWGQLGLTGDWANRPISLYGRNSASGTYGFFKEHVLKNGDYKDTVKEQPGSASVVQGVTEDRFGMGYSGIGYKTSGVRSVPLAESATASPSDGSYEDVKSGKYPLWRFLYIYINKAPGKALDPIVGEFVKLIFSKDGQDVVVKDGYMPLTDVQCQQELAKVSK